MQRRGEFDLLSRLHSLFIQPVPEPLQDFHYVYSPVRLEQHFQTNFSVDLLFPALIRVVGFGFESDFDGRVGSAIARLVRPCFGAKAGAAEGFYRSVAKTGTHHYVGISRAHSAAMARCAAGAIPKTSRLHR